MNVIIFNKNGEKDEEWNDVTEITLERRILYIIQGHCKPSCHRVSLADRRFLITDGYKE